MDTNSEAWRRDCEIRWVLNQAKGAREAYYADVQKHRGKSAMMALKDAVMVEYRRQQQEPSLF